MSAATAIFRWTNAYSVQVALLDQQHQRLFDVMNELDQALRAGEGNRVINLILDKLVNYASEHFATEESLMQQHEFPGLSTHRFQHDIFREKIRAFLDQHRADKPGVPVSLLLFMRRWLKDHVLRTDKQYSAYLNARGIR